MVIKSYGPYTGYMVCVKTTDIRDKNERKARTKLQLIYVTGRDKVVRGSERRLTTKFNGIGGVRGVRLLALLAPS